jgi:hypothetical protein
MLRIMTPIRMVWIASCKTATVVSLVWLNSKCTTSWWNSDRTPGAPIPHIPNYEGKGSGGHETKFFDLIIDAHYHHIDERGTVVISRRDIYYKCWWAVLASGVALTLIPLLVERIVFHWHQRKHTEAKPTNYS